MKRIDLVVANCGGCPFHQTVEQPFRLVDGPEVEQGHYCLHAKRRRVIVRANVLTDVRVGGVDEYLRTRFSEPFPDDCPLADMHRTPVPTGRRRVDLG